MGVGGAATFVYVRRQQQQQQQHRLVRSVIDGGGGTTDLAALDAHPALKPGGWVASPGAVSLWLW